MTCDARSIQDRARVARFADLPEHPRLISAVYLMHRSRRGLRVGMVRHRRPSKRGGGGESNFETQHDPNTKFTRGRQSRVVR
jgi:hypothetical protein